jgi:hypothetical protein
MSELNDWLRAIMKFFFMTIMMAIGIQMILWFLQQALQQVVQKLTLTHLGSGTMTADGTEQPVFRLDRAEPFKFEGYIDLSKMKTGDEVVIRQYVKIRPDGEFKKYWEYIYRGVQDNPIVYITPKPSIYGILVILQQTAGTPIEYDWEFYMSVT